jgi:hypothetical protein
LTAFGLFGFGEWQLLKSFNNFIEKCCPCGGVEHMFEVKEAFL